MRPASCVPTRFSLEGLPAIVALLALTVLVSACVNRRFDRRLSQAEQQVENDRSALEDTVDSATRHLDWERACRLMGEKNQRLRLGREQLADLERQRKRFALDQISPRLSAVANLSSALGSLAQLDDRDYGIRLFGSFNIPNPITVYARRYSLELQYYQSALSLHELERRLKATLYGQFLRYEALEQIETGKPEQGNLTGIWERAFSRERDELNEQRRMRSLRLYLNETLNTPGENWAPDVSSLPKISYANELSRLKPEKGYGRLALKQAAGQVEASLANLWRLKLERLPSFSTGVSVPTLYDSGLDENGFEADEVRLFGSLNESFDLSGREAESARQAEQRAILVQESLRSRLEREIYILDEAKQNYRNLLSERDKMLKLLRWMEKNPPPGGGPKVVLKRINEASALRVRLKQNELQRRQLDLEFWIWDEEYWKSPF